MRNGCSRCVFKSQNCSLKHLHPELPDRCLGTRPTSTQTMRLGLARCETNRERRCIHGSFEDRGIGALPRQHISRFRITCCPAQGQDNGVLVLADLRCVEDNGRWTRLFEPTSKTAWVPHMAMLALARTPRGSKKVAEGLTKVEEHRLELQVSIHTRNGGRHGRHFAKYLLLVWVWDRARATSAETHGSFCEADAGRSNTNPLSTRAFARTAKLDARQCYMKAAVVEGHTADNPRTCVMVGRRARIFCFCPAHGRKVAA